MCAEIKIRREMEKIEKSDLKSTANIKEGSRKGFI